MWIYLLSLTIKCIKIRIYLESWGKYSRILRKKLSDAGLGELMNEERIFIEAIDSIVQDAVKRSNKNVIGLVDLLAGGGGMVAGGGLGGVTAAVGIRAFQQPFTLTNLAQGINKLTKITKGIITPISKGVIGVGSQIKAD